MSTRAEALERLDIARRKVVATLRDAGEEHQANAHKALPAPGKKGWVHAYLIRMLQHATMFQDAKMSAERVRNRLKRAKSLSPATEGDLDLIGSAINAAEEALTDFRGAFVEVVEEGFRRGFIPDKATKPFAEVHAPARRRKASPS